MGDSQRYLDYLKSQRFDVSNFILMITRKRYVIMVFDVYAISLPKILCDGTIEVLERGDMDAADFIHAALALTVQDNDFLEVHYVTPYHYTLETNNMFDPLSDIIEFDEEFAQPLESKGYFAKLRNVSSVVCRAAQSTVRAVQRRSIEVQQKYQSIMLEFQRRRNRKVYREDITLEKMMDFVVESARLNYLMRYLKVNHEMSDVKDKNLPSEGSNIDVTAGSSKIQISEEMPRPDIEYVDSTTYIAKEAALLTNVADRWYHYTDFKWNGSQTANTEILYINIPQSLLNDENKTGLRILNNYTYIRADVELLIQVSTTQLHSGCLIMPIIYGCDENETQFNSKHILMYPSKPHVKIFAGANCEAMLNIPFRYPFSMMPIARFDELDNFKFAYVPLRVLNPLKYGANSITSVTGNISYRFKNIEVAGLRPIGTMPLTYDTVDHEMEEVNDLLTSGIKTLKLLTNLDRPRSDSSRVGIVPQIMQNPNIGTGSSDVTNVLALDNSIVTPHLEPINDCNIESFTRTFGMLKTIKWDVSHPVGKVLFECPVTPLLPAMYYTRINPGSDKELATFAVPPVGVIAALAGYFRGDIEFLLHVISTMFHAGKLLLGVIYGPRTKGYEPTVDQLMSCPFAIIDIAKSKEICFSAAYASHQLMYPRMQSTLIPSNDELFAPAWFYVVVYNQLAIQTQAISKDVEINFFMRGGPNFELFIPAQPMLVPTQHRKITPSPFQIIQAKSGYYPWYVGKWHLTGNVPMLRYGNTSDHIAQFATCAKGGIYQCLSTLPAIDMYYTNAQRAPSGYIFVPLYDKTGPYYYMIVLPYEVKGSLIASIKQERAEFNKQYGDFSFFVAFFKKFCTTLYIKLNKESEYCSGNPEFELVWSINDAMSFELLEHEIDERRDLTTDVIRPLQSKPLGNIHLGERPLDLLDLLKRFQLYGYIDVKASNNKNMLSGCVEIPIQLNGLLDDSQFIWKNIKDSVIAYVQTCFLFFKGSIKFKFICHDKDVLFWVQHKFDSRYDEDTVRNIISADSIIDVFNHGYAYMFCDSNINPCLEFEAPYYSPSDVIVTEPRSSVYNNPYQVQYTNLGSFILGANKDCKITILYALGDSSRFSLFIGPPPMGYLTNVPTSHEVGYLSGVAACAKSYLEGTKAKIGDIRNSAAGYLRTGEMLNDLSSKTTEFKDYVSDCILRLGELFKQIIAKPLYDSIKHVIITLMSNLAHVLHNPTRSACYIMIGALFTSIGIFTIDFVLKLLELLKKLFGDNDIDTSTASTCDEDLHDEQNFSEFWDRVDELNREGSDPHDVFMDHEGPRLSEASPIPSLISLLYMTLAGTIDYKQYRGCSRMHTWKSMLLDDLPRRCHFANFVFTFVTNIWKLLKDMSRYIYSKMCPEFSAYDFFSDKEKIILEWACEVERLSRPDMWERIKVNKVLVRRIKTALDFGSIIMTKFLLIKNLDNDLNLFGRCKVYNDKIIKLYQKCCDHALYAVGATEPFVIWVYGDTGVGKSHIKDRIIKQLITYAKIPYEGELIYTVPALPNFWTGCSRQPCVYWDDFLFKQSDDILDKTILAFNSLKSPAAFNPPMAEIEEKRLIYNPKLMYINSNHSFPVLDGVQHIEAFYRRRDILVKIRVKAEYQSFYRDGHFDVEAFRSTCNRGPIFADNILKSRGNLEFGIHKSVTDPIQQEIEWMSYNEFMLKACSKFVKFLEQQLVGEMERLAVIECDDEASSFYNLYDDMNLNDIIFRSYKASPDLLLSDEESMRRFFDLKSEYVVEHEMDRLFDHEGKNVDDIRRERFEQCYEEATSTTTSNTYFTKFFGEKLADPNADNCYTFEQLILDQVEPVLPDLNRCVRKCMCRHTDQPYLLNYAIICDSPKWSKRMVLRAGYKYEVICHENTISYDVYKNNIVYYPLPLDVGCNYKYCPFMTYSERQVKTGEWHAACPLDVKYYSNDVLNKYDDTWKIKFTAMYRNFQDNLRFQVNEFKKNLNSVCVWCYDNADLIVRLLINMLVIITLVYRFLVQRRIYESIDKTEHEIYYSADPKIYKAKKRPPVKITTKTFEHEGNAVKDIGNILNSIRINTCYIVAFIPNKAPLTMRLFGLYDRKAIILRHYVEVLKALNCKIDFVFIGLNPKLFRCSFDFNNCEVTYLQNSSIGIIELPKQIPQFRNYTKLIANETKHRAVGNTGFLVELIIQNDEIQARQYPVNITVEPRIMEAEGAMSEVTLDAAYVYQVHGKGMCGSLLVMQNSIVGVHVGGRNGFGCAEPIVRESFIKDTDIIPDKVIPHFTEDGEYTLDGSIIPIGYVDKTYAHHESGKTQLSTSLLYECFGDSVMEPSVLSSNDPRLVEKFDPMIEGCKFHTDPIDDFDINLVKDVYADLKNLYIAKIKPLRPPGVLDIATAVVGIPGLKGYEAMKMDTSEGYPYTKRRPFMSSNKSWMFQFDIDSEGNKRLIGLDDQLQNIMKLKYSMRVQKITPFTLFVDCLKDCKVPKEKIQKKGATRIFSISPVDFTIQTRMYFLDFAASYQNSRFSIGSGIGIAKNSSDWTALVTSLLGNSNNIIAGDYSKFGPRLNATCLYYAFQLIIDWYVHYGATIKETNIREVMREEVVNSIHLMYDFVYQVLCGAPSGNPLTVILNDIVNHMYLRIAWLHLTKVGFSAFYANVQPYTYGDDLIMSVKDEYIKIYNVNSLSQFFGLYGLKFTDADKSEGNFRDYISIFEATFLKSGFKPHPFRHGIWLAPLDLKCAEEAAYWVHDKDNIEEATVVNAEACLLELYGHGPVIYKEHSDVIQERLRSNGVHYVPRSWIELDQMFFD